MKITDFSRLKMSGGIWELGEAGLVIFEAARFNIMTPMTSQLGNDLNL